MRILDLYCKGGGAGMGYHQAGFEVVGVDIRKQKRYPFEFIQADVLTLDMDFIKSFDVIHASPPCQTHSATRHLRIAQGKNTSKIDLIPQTRSLLKASGKPYIIENVPGAPLINPIVLCGSSFGLKVRRHRLFESNLRLETLICNHKAQGRPVGIYGSMRDEIPGGGRTAATMGEAKEAMGIDWLIWDELKEAIPPAYTEFIGKQLSTGLHTAGDNYA